MLLKHLCALVTWFDCSVSEAAPWKCCNSGSPPTGLVCLKEANAAEVETHLQRS